MRLTRLLPLLALLALVAVPATASAKVAVGIADNKPEMFGDARYKQLGIRFARLDISYDALSDPTLKPLVDQWMFSARLSGTRPLVTFDRSRRKPSYNPSPAQLVKAMQGFRARYPGLNEFATWNEVNIAKRPETVAKWWLALRRACPTCTILAADLLDRDNVARWAQRFVVAAKRTPKVWGLHNYNDANTLKTTGTRALLKAVGGAIWFTETGGVVSRHNGSTIKFPMSAAHAAKATSFVFNVLAKLSPRIQRVYLYHWNTGVGDGTTWDSGLIGPDDKGRPALKVLATLLGVTVTDPLPLPVVVPEPPVDVPAG